MSDTKNSVSIGELFADYPIPQFIDEYLHRLPFALPLAAKPASHWGTWDTIAAAIGAPVADIMVVRSNERYPGDIPSDPEKIKTLSHDGYTILVKHMERHHEGMAELANQFAQTFRGPVDVHIYVTPPDQYGFSWHYDAEDVFILQLVGDKEYSLRKNTVNPWPLEETLPQDMQYERELMPLMRVKLCAGDMLYIPAGYWHRAATLESSDTAFSLAIGVLPRTAMDVFDLIRPQLLDSLLWRQRLPLSHDVSQDGATFQEILEMLASDLTKTLTSSQFKERIMTWNKT